MFHDFISLLYPRNCLSCGNSLFKHEEHVCNYCYVNLPKSNFHNQAGNPIEKLFYGRVPIVAAAGYYLFNKHSGIQKVLHDIKYKSNTDLAVCIGRWYGEELLKSERFRTIQAIIPVPLHPDKLRARGYNQSELFGQGLAESMQVPVVADVLKRRVHTSTQTRKTRMERWDNIENAFEVKDTTTLKDQPVLVVDDVITTGATLEACCAALQQTEGVQIHVASIAYATV